MFLGLDPRGRIAGTERVFERAMGLHATRERLHVSTRYQIWQMDNVLPPGQLHEGYDRLYIPRVGYTTGDIDVHDLVVETAGSRVVFISTLLNCMATVSARHSCVPLWKPPFISALVNEDRCHLNGLALVDGRARYATACGRTDAANGWRENRETGGCAIDIRTDEIVATGLSMPHSPRFYRGKLWVLNSGTGYFGHVDLDRGIFEPVTFCPGFLRGLAFVDDHAIVGLSKPRGPGFSGLPLDETLTTRGTEPRCGFSIVSLDTGEIVHEVALEGEITELYDVQVLPGVTRPNALGFISDEIARLITLDPSSPLLGLQ
jgi:uncharacterized protein (TIGR03032 family)